MTTTIAFYGALIAAFAYLATYGGKTGLWGVSLYSAGSLLSLWVAIGVENPFERLWLMAAVDFLSLGWKLALAIWSTRNWPIWVAAFQVNVVAAHLSIWMVPSWRGELYYAMTTVWAIPTLLAMVIGTILDNRHAAEKRIANLRLGIG